MGIRVECPNGHIFKFKDKYAGKKGICPHCPGQVIVFVPEAIVGKETERMAKRAAAAMPKPEPTPESAKSGEKSGSIHDVTYEEALAASSSGSLLGSSAVVRAKKECPKCGTQAPLWYASCQKCGVFLPEP